MFDVSKLPKDVRDQLMGLLQIVPSRPTVAETGKGGPGINLPLTPQTDPRYFPSVHGPDGKPKFEYPKMACKRATPEDIAWYRANRTSEHGHGAAPRVGQPIPILSTLEHVDAGFASTVDQPLIFENKEQQEAFCGKFPETAKLIFVDEPAKREPAGLSDGEREELKQLLEENNRLRAKLAGDPKPDPAPKADAPAAETVLYRGDGK
jgi:hypothetical protein